MTEQASGHSRNNGEAGRDTGAAGAQAIAVANAAASDVAADTDVAIVGGGPVGLAAALALAKLGLSVSLLAAAGTPAQRTGAKPASSAQPPRDTRTAALFPSSLTMLMALGVSPDLMAIAAPLRAIRLIDATQRRLRAPETLFEAAEIGQNHFGLNIANTDIVAALEAAMARAIAQGAQITRVATAGVTGVAMVDRQTGLAVIEMKDAACVTARLVIGADGRRSICRQAAGIAASERPYGQIAIACNLAHSRPHDDISNEFHTAEGPFTTVPLPGHASSLVWVCREERAKGLMALDDEAFRAAVDAQSSGLLGTITGVGPRGAFPLSSLTVARYGASRTMLAGEAAHVFPPIGAQGLNLGLRDVASAHDCIAEALARRGDIGGNKTLAAYDAARRGDVMARTVAVDLLNRSLLSGLLPVQIARSFGLQMLKSWPQLRRAMIRQGLAPMGEVPRLMRGLGNPAASERIA